ncbi:MAG: molybdopterin biosynthesis protein MoeB [Elusimicrobia bacterium ADurb.Bin231]|nr:MAG: molybdopterin biosynthesis protein MoeB [Elusimicrobia bacterium ADurb.Bin231]
MKNLSILLLCTLFQITGYCFAADNLNDAGKISIEKLREIQTSSDKNYVLIDIAHSSAYDIEHIEGAINISIENMERDHNNLPEADMFITYCHCGSDASTAKFAADKLKKLGYKNVFYLSEPFIKYKNAGYPVFADLTRAATNLHIVSDVESGINNQMVSIEILHSRILYHPEEINTNFYIIDLRTKEEYEKGHIQGALNIQPSELFEKTTAGGVAYERFPKEKEIFFYGEKDAARKVVEELYRIGYKVAYYLSGDYDDWTEMLKQ